MRYVCGICGFIWDEEKEKTSFDSLPPTWKCPLCGAGKTEFRPEGRIVAPAVPSPPPLGGPEEEKLSPGQLSVLCSSLARGCEKQYKPGEAALFRQLAEYFASVSPPIADASTERVAELLMGDIANYPSVRAAADEVRDRGAARICVWGEKVTRMLSSLVGRYLREGEEMLAGTEIWICTVCGFVFVGDAPPPICPVCKVPARKFEKVEGRSGT